MGRKKKTLTSRRQLDYQQRYNKENYKQLSIRLRTEEKEKLEKVLEGKKENLKDYVMEKVNQDLQSE